MFHSFELYLLAKVNKHIHMKKFIGNVIVRKSNFKVEDCFKKCLSMVEINTSLPTLIIGLENAKTNIDNFNILIKRYENDLLWWTFNKTERRVDYEKDIIDFRNFCIRNVTKNFCYHNINLIETKYSNAKKYIEFIKSIEEKYYFIDKDKFVYIYCINHNENIKHIYGFSLNTASFFGIRKDKIIKLIENNPFNRKINNFYAIPNNIRNLVNDDIPSEMILLEYF